MEIIECNNNGKKEMMADRPYRQYKVPPNRNGHSQVRGNKREPLNPRIKTVSTARKRTIHPLTAKNKSYS